jgi:hypothetical protein
MGLFDNICRREQNKNNTKIGREFKVSLGYIARFCPKKKTKAKPNK